MIDFASRLEEQFGRERVGRNVPLSVFTTFRVGGPAEWFVEPRGSDEIVAALDIARDSGIAVTILGGGSNVLIADSGIKGLVVHPKGGEIDRVDKVRVRADAAVTINGLVRWTIL